MSFYDFTAVACLILFITIFTFRTVVLTKSGVKIFVIGEGKKGYEKFLELLFFVSFPLWLAAVLLQGVRGEIFFLPEFLTRFFWNSDVSAVTGIILLLLGLGIFSYALISFRDSWRIGIDNNNPGGLVTGGAFSFSRNPIFFSMYLFFAGISLLYPGLFFLIFTAGAIGGIHMQILQEEKFLREHYGDTYREYLLRVRRYF